MRKAGSADSSPLVAMLARAYYDDPLYRWCFPDDSQRLEQLRQLVALFGLQIFGYEETHTTDGTRGAALWLPPDKWRMCPVTKVGVVHGLLTTVGVRVLPRALRTLYLMQSKHPHEPSHYHLPFIGVEPQEQGKGIGTALLQPVLARCDLHGLPVYVEATTSRNVAFFERHDFEVTRQIALRGGPLIWPMWRQPKRG